MAEVVQEDQERVTDLLGALAYEARKLVWQEFALARLEMSQMSSRIGVDLAVIASGALLAYAGALLLLGAATLWLSTILPGWAAAAIVGGVTAVVGVSLLLVGQRRLSKETLVPEETVASLREGVE